MITRKAKYEDIAKITEICRLNLVGTNKENFSADDFSKRGFLVTAISEDLVKEMIDDHKNHLVFIAQENEEIIGYLTACNIEIMPDDFLPSFKETLHKKTIYYKQIAKKPGTQNVGDGLLNLFIKEAQENGYEQIICHIVHQPFFNQKSITFHEKYNFRNIGETIQNKSLGETTLGIYLRKL